MTIRFLVCWVWVIHLPWPAQAQPARDTAQTPTVFEYFQREKILDFSFELDLDALIAEKDSNTYRPALMRYTDLQGIPRSVLVEVRPKGHSRRKICDIPPLKVRFPDGFLSSNRLSPEAGRIIEMVLVCKNDGIYNQYVLREFLSYKLYNLLTDKSFRVQLGQIALYAKGDRQPATSGYAFFIEPEKDLAHRLQAKVLEPKRMSSKGLQAGEFDLLTLFQFMIGNTDWYILNRHNTAILQCAGDSLPIAVPFDFDYCGLVNAPYAVPPTRLALSHVTTRYFLGLCRRPEEWATTFQLFQDKKPALLQCCRDLKALNKDSRRYAESYLQGFFDLLADPVKVKEQILEHCGMAFIK